MFRKRKKLVIFGKALQEMRKMRGFSASSVANGAKITRQQLSNYETGKFCMSINKLIRISDAMILTAEERRDLYNLYEPARKEAYENFSTAAKKREEKACLKRKNVI